LYMLRFRYVKKRGHPLKGVSREKTPFHEKNSFFFFAWKKKDVRSIYIFTFQVSLP
jgi:hypothetical protein